ncbi:MAG: hypothetical protein TRG1_1178 [Flavobacteriaceae bacterium FS1-H7996/R]|nr:MAG: hypothetical protein TRG1_1178 [Flavobacteriaceae bacterium FS1-H7996/R]
MGIGNYHSVKIRSILINKDLRGFVNTYKVLETLQVGFGNLAGKSLLNLAGKALL